MTSFKLTRTMSTQNKFLKTFVAWLVGYMNVGLLLVMLLFGVAAAMLAAGFSPAWKKEKKHFQLEAIISSNLRPFEEKKKLSVKISHVPQTWKKKLEDEKCGKCQSVEWQQQQKISLKYLINYQKLSDKHVKLSHNFQHLILYEKKNTQNDDDEYATWMQSCWIKSSPLLLCAMLWVVQKSE